MRRFYPKQFTYSILWTIPTGAIWGEVSQGPTQSHGISCYSHEINRLIRVHQHDFPIFFVSHRTILEAMYLQYIILVVCFVPAPNNNKLEGKKDDIKYRFQYSEALSPIYFPH